MKSKKLTVRTFLSKYMIYFAFIALLIIFCVTLRNVGKGFLDMGNLWNIIRQTSLIAILAVGMTYALGAGQIDLSVGSIVGLTSLVTAWVVQGVGLVAGVLAGLCVGLAIGALNGVLIAWVMEEFNQWWDSRDRAGYVVSWDTQTGLTISGDFPPGVYVRTEEGETGC